MKSWHRPLVALGLLAPACAPSSAPPAQRASTGTTAPLHPLIPADEATTTTEAATTTTEPLSAAVVTIEGIPAPTRSGTTTTTFVVPEAETESDADWWEAQPGYVAPATGREALLACIRSYESGGDYGAVSPSGQYRGAYQFDRGTWSSAGGSGDPAAAPPAEQDARAWALYQSRGLQPWPTPARRCG